ncbi:MAG: SusD/RagB family nutrient-binding outer membrane lipoprotein [Bacteroidales bacterium]
MNIHNRKYLKQTRQNLRNNLTSAEATLWTYLQNRKLDGRKFRRQHSIGNFVVDFYCPQEKIALELDGKDHFTDIGFERDLKRDAYIKSLNIKVIHIENQEVFKNIEEVLMNIAKEFTTPAPPKTGGELKTSPAPPETGRELKTTPAPPITGGELKTTPAPPKTGGELKTTPAPPETGGELKTTPAPPETGWELKTSPAPPKTGRELKTSPAPPETGGELKTTLKSVLVFLFVLLFLFSSCSEWLGVNKDPNNPDQANEKLTISAGISSVAYVYGGKYQVLGALWSQHWTQSPGASQYSGLDAYDINSSTYDNRQYGELYTGALKNLEYVRNLAHQKQNWGYYLIATVMQCYTFQLLADLYNDIPFSQALKGDEELVNPVFENGQDIYDSLIIRLDYALTRDFDAETVEEVGNEDLIFAGKIERWKQFANTLKLKIYLRQVYKNPEKTGSGIRAVFNDPDVRFLTNDAAMTQFTGETGRSNPLYETEVRVFNNPNLILSYTLYSFLTENGDIDRLDAMFDYPETGGNHKSLIQGNYNDPDEPTGTNSSGYSKPIFFANAPVYLMSASEANFILAEAIVRYGVKSYADAKDYYHDGILISFQRLLLPFGYSLAEISDLAESLYGTGGPYEFPAEDSPVEDFMKAIISQKWIALAGIQSLETFFEHNRTRYPKESTVPASDEGNYVPGEFTVSVNNVTSGRFPKRLIYPESEYSSNPNTPAKKEVFEKIWWDVKID